MRKCLFALAVLLMTATVSNAQVIVTRGFRSRVVIAPNSFAVQRQYFAPVQIAPIQYIEYYQAPLVYQSYGLYSERIIANPNFLISPAYAYPAYTFPRAGFRRGIVFVP